MYVSYLPHFVPETDRPGVPLPRSFKICSLRGFAGDLEESSLYVPGHSFRAYLERTKSAVFSVSFLFGPPSFSVSSNI